MNYTIIARRAVLISVAVAALLNFAIVGTLFGELGFNVMRVVIAFAGGWLVVRRTGAGLGVAALVGVIVLLIDHVLLKGGGFLLAQAFWPESVQGQGFMGFAGVLISFVMFVPVAALVSALGGIAARRLFRDSSVHP